MATLARIEYRGPLEDSVRYLEYLDSRRGYIGRVRVPLKVAFKLIDWEIRIVHAWRAKFRPYLLHPDQLDGMDGEPPHYLRADLAPTAEAAIEYWLEQWGYEDEDSDAYTRWHADILAQMQPVEDVVRVWMVPRTDPSLPEDDEYATWYVTVTAGTPGATAYWEWNWRTGS